ncbi:Hypothetical protein CINCED_3A015738 [Cinara cedri]|uniref:Uncharacterized protein n=1 Tax=Cinara cedri TaxID=506608 RepID=A0A5E4N3V4_9HEMI|nr:Hypothetical protein CINCED_3A015738 [Cinara cedri]
MSKIPNTHLHPNTWQKMKVRCATQIFNRTVSALICSFGLRKWSELRICEDDNDGYLTIDVLSYISTNEKPIIENNPVVEVLDELDSTFLSNSNSNLSSN